MLKLKKMISVISKLHPVTNLPINAEHIIEETDDLIIVHIKD